MGAKARSASFKKYPLVLKTNGYFFAKFIKYRENRSYVEQNKANFLSISLTRSCLKRFQNGIMYI